MFTGIVEAVGTVRAIQPKGGDVSLYIATASLDLGDVQLGDSIATNGVCLTAVRLPGDGFWADVSNETIARTTLHNLQVGSSVNLEKALMPQSRLGGHMVSGHVDGVGEVVSIKPQGRSLQYRVKAPDELARYIAEKGSITVDGVSLTVNGVEGAVFDLNIVPHTAGETLISEYQVGSSVNLEVDLIARYLERLLLGDGAAQGARTGLTQQMLAQNGFWK